MEKGEEKIEIIYFSLGSFAQRWMQNFGRSTLYSSKKVWNYLLVGYYLEKMLNSILGIKCHIIKKPKCFPFQRQNTVYISRYTVECDIQHSKDLFRNSKDLFIGIRNHRHARSVNLNAMTIKRNPNCIQLVPIPVPVWNLVFYSVSACF